MKHVCAVVVFNLVMLATTTTTYYFCSVLLHTVHCTVHTVATYFFRYSKQLFDERLNYYH